MVTALFLCPLLSRVFGFLSLDSTPITQSTHMIAEHNQKRAAGIRPGGGV